MNTKRLTLMRDMLVEVRNGRWRATGPLAGIIADEPVTFDLSDWAEYRDDGATEPDETIECGFQACAVGHALLDKRFQAMGLEDVDQDYLLDVLENGDLPTFEAELSPEYNGRANFEGVAHFFDIEYDVAMHLFHPERYADVHDVDEVIHRIDTLLTGDPA